MKIKEILQSLEQWAPPALQEDYDNAGLICGNNNDECTGVLVTLDSTEDVVQEAIDNKCNLIIAHHPIVFRGLKKLTPSTYVERTLLKAIKNDIAIYAIHTNLDNVHTGVNKKICDRLKLSETRILSPKRKNLLKLITFVPKPDLEKVQQALFDAGAGNLGNYSECSYQLDGKGSFKPNEDAKPAIGTANIRESVEEIRLEVILPSYREGALLKALLKSHPYEEPAYDLISLENSNSETGSGMIGNLHSELSEADFLQHLKDSMGLKVVRVTPSIHRKIRKVAVCGGSGSFLTRAAIASGADAYVTADVKYHEFFDADGKILLADIGHFESEAFTKELIRDFLIKKFSNIAVRLSETGTNPIRYI